MCIVVLVNVIVIAALKNQIAEDYAASISETMRESYTDAISDALKDTDVIDDVKESAASTVLDKLQTSTSEVIAANCMASVVTISCSSTQGTGTASGFVISDVDTAKGITVRYVVTNAHVVLYEKQTLNGYSGPFQTYSYSVAQYDTITCRFDGESTSYELEVVAIGGVTFDRVSSENTDQADLAICAFKGTQPDETKHPSLKIAAAKTDDDGNKYVAKTGDTVALIGNPQGIGLSISDGIISNATPNMTIFGSIVGEFLMTDAAVNNGNSGGPLIDKNCVVIGVVESKLASSSIDNMGFAVSATTLNDFIAWAQLAANNELNKTIVIPYKNA